MNERAAETGGEDHPQTSADTAAIESAGDGDAHIDDALREEAHEAAERGARPGGLDVDSANALACERRTTVLVLAGAVNSGKTSIFASLYERFGRGPLAGRLFAGSRTLTGFEERCHGWREASGYGAPQIEHTRSLSWLHVRFQDQEQRLLPQDLLMGDIPGEVFAALLDGRTPGAELRFLWRADHVCVLLDGEHLRKSEERHAELEQARNLVRELLRDDVLASPSALSILVTKLDLVVAAPVKQQEIVEEEIAGLRDFAQELRADMQIPVLRTAARSETDKFPLGHGLEELLDLVTEHPARHVVTEFEVPAPAAGNSFARFLA